MKIFDQEHRVVQCRLTQLLSDVAKLKAKGGKRKYMSEADMIEISAKFAPYR